MVTNTVSRLSPVYDRCGVALTAVLAVLLINLLATTGADLVDQVGEEYAEVKKLLGEIRLASLKRHGVFEEPIGGTGSKPSKANFSDGTEASINRALLPDLFEADIVLTVPQAKQILREVKYAEMPRRSHRPRRQALPTASSYWSNFIVPYSFDPNYEEADWRSLIRRALNHVELETCMRFVEKRSDSKDYLEFTRAAGCWSSVGRVGGRQPVSIGYGCELLGIVAHESLHALGLWHEQSRTDRDTYITIDTDQIFPGTQSNFEKRTPSTSENLGQPYDLGSVMHYGNRAFSIDYNKYSIFTRDVNYQQTIGQRAGISFKDAKILNIRYCQSRCPTKLPCENGGYTDPNNCNICKCPDGYSGTYCHQIPESNAVYCRGGEYQAFSTSYNLTVPYVTANTGCYFRIVANKNQRVQMTVHKLNFPCRDACESYVEVKHKRDKVATGARFCCTPPKSRIVSEDSEVILIFKGHETLASGYQGFIIEYRSVFGTTGVIATTTTTPETSSTPDPQTTPDSTTATELTTTPSTTPESTTTTEEGAKPTQTPDPAGEWSDWANWSECTESCGGCGKRKRVRACYGGHVNCPGRPYEWGNCGLEPCPIPFLKKTFRCDGRLVMPCNLIEQLDFGTVLNYDTIPHISRNDTAKASFLPLLYLNRVRREGRQESPQSPDGLLLPTVRNAKALKRIRRHMREERAKRFVNGNNQLLDKKLYCEKTFSYNCPTALLTVSMDWRSSKPTVTGDDRLCCKGYHLLQETCVPKPKVQQG